jgi:hypothetical protein
MGAACIVAGHIGQKNAEKAPSPSLSCPPNAEAEIDFAAVRAKMQGDLMELGLS